MTALGPTPPRGDDFPCDDGEPMETGRHRAQMNLLADSLDEYWRDRTDVAVAGNMGLYFSETQAKKNDFRAPDVFVVLDTVRKERKRWVVWEEDGRMPDAIIELVSESTEQVDRVTKKNLYAHVLHVPSYVIYDPFSAQLDVYRLVGREYERVEPDARGLVPCEPLGLYLGIVQGVRHDIDAPWLRWFDREGNMIPELRELAERARDLEAEVARLREELARRGG
ncbi:MAG: Uma2 family endonuclease [Polyangiales bacterium]